jgi:hypothetical protein
VSAPETPTAATPGTLDWVFAEYRADRRFTKLDVAITRSPFGWWAATSSKMAKDLGLARVERIDTSVVDALL